jgi:hypothetical protein
MNTIRQIRQNLKHDVFDYQTLLGALKIYSKPRDHITRLLAAGDIVRIKKGLYCFGEPFRRGPICREHVANLLFGPSYISLDYALAFHGIIPERVEVITSVTTQRSRSFSTPIGHFSYARLSEARYSIGGQLEQHGDNRFLLATPEKALVDKVWKDKRFSGQRLSEFRTYLSDDLRVDDTMLISLNETRLAAITDVYKSRKVRNLYRYIQHLKGGHNA